MVLKSIYPRFNTIRVPGKQALCSKCFIIRIWYTKIGSYVFKIVCKIDFEHKNIKSVFKMVCSNYLVHDPKSFCVLNLCFKRFGTNQCLKNREGAVSKHRVILSEAKILSLKVSKKRKRKIFRNEVPQDDKAETVLRQPLCATRSSIWLRTTGSASSRS